MERHENQKTDIETRFSGLAEVRPIGFATEMKAEENESYLDGESLLPLPRQELAADEYVQAVKRIPEIHGWFDDVQLEIVDRHESGVIERPASVLITRQLGELYEISGHPEYRNMAQERYLSASTLYDDSLEKSPFWVEAAVARGEKRELDRLMSRIDQSLSLTESHAEKHAMPADALRRKLLQYAYVVNGYARLGYFEDMAAYFDRLDNYWYGAESTRYFDWLNDERQVTKKAGRSPKTPERRTGETDDNDEPIELYGETERDFTTQNRKFFALIDEARAHWLKNQLDQYEIDDCLPNEQFARITTGEMEASGEHHMIYAQINRVTDFALQRELHEQHYWRQPAWLKGKYENDPNAGPIFANCDHDLSHWTPRLLGGKEERRLFNLADAGEISMPNALRRLVEQFDNNPSMGPIKKLVMEANRENNRVQRGGRELLEIMEKRTAEIRAFTPHDQEELIGYLSQLATVAVSESNHGFQIRLLLEKAILTGEKEDYSEFSKARSEHGHRLNRESNEALTVRLIQHHMDWGELTDAIHEYEEKALEPERRIRTGLDLLRTIINIDTMAGEKSVHRQETLALYIPRIAGHIDAAVRKLEAEAINAKKNSSDKEPLASRIGLYKRITGPSPHQKLSRLLWAR